MRTRQYEIKRAILDTLFEAARTGPLSTLAEDEGPLQVKRDARPLDMEARCLYAGGTRMERPPEDILQDGQSVAMREVVYSSWFIRIQGPSDVEIEDLERVAQDVGEAFETLVSDDPFLAGDGTVSFISVGQADHDWEDVSNVVGLMYEVRTESIVQ